MQLPSSAPDSAPVGESWVPGDRLGGQPLSTWPAPPSGFSNLQRPERRAWLLWAGALGLVVAVVFAMRWLAHTDSLKQEAARLVATGQAMQQVLTLQLGAAPNPYGALRTLRPLLATAVYADDMAVTLDTEDGPILAQAGLAAAHAGAAASMLRWQQAWSVDGMAKPLRLVLQRDRHAVLAGWRERTLVAVVVWTVVFGAAAVALHVLQRRRRADEAQRRLHIDRLSLALQGADLGLWDADLQHGLIMVDARANQMLGLPAQPTTIRFEDWRAQVHPQDWPAVHAAHEACLQGASAQRNLRCRLQHAGGRWVMVVDRGKVLQRDAAGRPLRMLGTRMDISETVAAQEAVRRSDERLQQVVRSAGIGVFDIDHLAGTRAFTPEHHVMWGFEPDEDVPPSVFLKRLHPADAEQVAVSLRRGQDPQGDGRFECEHRIIWPDGQVRWLRVRAQTFFEAQDGAVAGQLCPARTVGGVMDITDARIAQDRLRQQAALLDQAQDAITVRRMDDRIAYWNGGAERLYGWTAAEALGRECGELLRQPPALAAEIQARLLSEGEYTAVVPEHHKDGRLVQMEGRFRLLRDEHGEPEGFFSIKTDVTRRLELEAQLRQAQRLEAVGQLTGGVAHDFNNLLTVVLGTVDLLAEQLSDRPPLKRLAEMARAAAQRGAELTHGLLAFARRQPLQPQSVSVNDSLAGMEGLLRRTLREDIDLELVRGAGLWPALVDPAQLESAVLNLVLNARDAMPAGGKITLETANAHIDQDYADRHAEVACGQYVQVTLSDTGQGMTADQLSKAFEPFYTTKGVGKGTGLGLSMVYGFVKQSRGHIKMYSELGHGTTVRMYLPRSDEGPPLATPLQPDDEQAYRGTETVLVVEDDALVRGFASDMLLRLGYTVLLSEDGPGAMAIMRSRNDIDLLFTDVVMPGGMNGRELAEQATALRPQLKVLFTSGYTENAIVHHGRLDRGVQLLAKPYRSIDLARKVRAVISGS